ncbi:hypothetical protein [Craterilacuibacter sp.]|uniref:hypothetical protein n=1 Tax=Craterilacuibacter sp. TaxID=2870909 RepID=UPI003F302E8A
MSGPIVRYLPIRFANGSSISRFAKNCPQCKTLVQSENMDGEAAMVQNRLFIVALAHCPSCKAEFKVSCVITDDKRVHKASLPQWLLLLWLRQATPANLPVQDAKDWDMEPANAPPAVQGIQLPQGMEPVPSADIIGRYENAPIPATLQCGSRHFVFDRVQPVSSAVLAGNELLFAGNLVYREA